MGVDGVTAATVDLMSHRAQVGGRRARLRFCQRRQPIVCHPGCFSIDKSTYSASANPTDFQPPTPTAHHPPLQKKVSYDPNATGPRFFVDAVESAGFDCQLAPDGTLSDDAGAAQRAELEAWAALLFWGVLFTVPLFIVAMVLPLMGVSWMRRVLVMGFPLDQLVKWALATPVQVRRGAWGAVSMFLGLVGLLYANLQSLPPAPQLCTNLKTHPPHPP